MAETANQERGHRKIRRGSVISKSGEKSVVVLVESRKQHPLYGKVIKTKTKLHVHDAENTANVGDKVVVVETRPISRLKRWRIQEVVA